MLIYVYHYRHWSESNDSSFIIPTFATEGWIERAKGEMVSETKREIDERLLDTEGKAIIQLGSEDWNTLKDLASHSKQRFIISGNIDLKPWDYLVKVKLINIRVLSLSDTEYEVTELGRLALKQLS